MLDEICHLKRDLELACSERRHEEGSHTEMTENYEKLLLTVGEMRDAQVSKSLKNYYNLNMNKTIDKLI